MTLLETQVVGLTLKNPIIVAAGPWAGDAKGIQKAIDAGAGMVVTETITLEEYHRTYPRVYQREGSMLSTSLFGNCSLEEWESEFEKIKKKDSKIIGSIRAGTSSELAYIARKVERLGVDGIQLDLYAPIGSVIMGMSSSPEQLLEFVEAVKKEVSVPVIVRLPHSVADNTRFLKALEYSGIDAVSFSESIRGILGVNIEKANAMSPTYGAYTGKAVLPITLAAVAAASQITNLPISAVGGIRDYTNVIEAIMLGASTVQLGSSVMLEGYSFITETIESLAKWMNDHGYNSLEEIRGKALSSLFSYDELDQIPKVAAVDECGFCKNCRKCIRSCLAEAIYMENNSIVIYRDQCSGCGLCGAICPEHCIHMISK